MKTVKQEPSLTKFLDSIKPPLARILARDRSSRGKPLTLIQIAAAGGLGFGRTRWIAKQKTWGSVLVRDAEAFLKGCGITLVNWSDEQQFLKRTRKSQTPLLHLESLSSRQKRSILRNMKQ